MNIYVLYFEKITIFMNIYVLYFEHDGPNTDFLFCFILFFIFLDILPSLFFKSFNTSSMTEIMKTLKNTIRFVNLSSQTINLSTYHCDMLKHYFLWKTVHAKA